MKNLLSENVTYLEGLESIKLYSCFDDVTQFLKDNKIQYNYEFWPNKGCTPEVPWKIIRIQNSIHMFFAKDKLWKIYLENDFKGSLNNGIKLGMDLSKAKQIDETLKFDDWEEVYLSSNFYEIEDNLEDGTIMSICIFIKEMADDDIFYNYEW